MWRLNEVFHCVNLSANDNSIRSFIRTGFLLVLIAGFLAPASWAQYGGGSGEPNDPYLIYTAEQMNTIGLNPGDWSAHFALMADIDLGIYTGQQFNIIGENKPHSRSFSGSFDGRGHTIRHFSYSVPKVDETEPLEVIPGSIGIFGFVYDGLKDPFIKDLVLIDPNVDAGPSYLVGALVGQLSNGTISGCRIQGGSVSGNRFVGGFVGGTFEISSRLDERALIDCHSLCQITGGICGGIAGSFSTGYILDCRSSGVVRGIDSVGGLIGTSQFNTISHSYNIAHVTGENAVGGLVGEQWGGRIHACFASGLVIGQIDVGGLIGKNVHGTVQNSYSLAGVTGESNVGGLLGVNQGIASYCHASGSVTGTENVGGFIGSLDADSLYPAGTVSDSFWDIETSGQTSSVGGLGKTTIEMKQKASFENWDFNEVWDIAEDQTYPFLRKEHPYDLNHNGIVDSEDLSVLTTYLLNRVMKESNF